MSAITINLNSIMSLNDEQFYQLCQNNPDTKFERNTNGEIIIMPPTGGETGTKNADLIGQFWFWNRQTQLGKVFDSSTGYKLANRAVRSPDVSWIQIERWDGLTPEQKQKFIPIAPDFVLELMSPSDNLEDTQVKMQEYIDNQVKLGWLIDTQNNRVEIYRLGQEKEILESPNTLSGDDVLPDFVLDLQFLWE